MATITPKSKPSTPKFFNRELSWLAFNERVLDQAFSEKYPLLERTRFLSFVSSNLDQFYEIRVAGLMQKVDAGITRPSLMEVPLRVYWKRFGERAHAMSQREYDCWRLIYSHLWPRMVFISNQSRNYPRKNLPGCGLIFVGRYFLCSHL